MKKNYVLVDYENVQPKSLELLKPEHFSLRIFLGPTATRVPRGLATAMQPMGSRAEYVELEVSGPNALDFHIAYYLGRLTVAEPTAFFHVISKDHGFDPLIAHLKSQGIFAARSESIEQMPCFVTASAAAAAAAPAKANAAAAGSTTLIDDVIANLVKRKSARPAKEKTLLNSIHNMIGKDQPIAGAEALLAALIKRKLISVANNKVQYKLPGDV